MTGGISNRGTVTAAERRAEEVVLGARAAVADLLGCAPAGVVFARSVTQADLRRVAGAGQAVGPRRRGRGDPARPRREHPAVGAGRRARPARPSGGSSSTGDRRADRRRGRRRAVRRAPGWSRSPEPPTCSAPGPTSRPIAEAVHAAGALLYVDGVHLTPHAPVDVADLGADFYACSPYKFLGPHHGVVAADPALLEELRPGQAAALDRRRARAVRARHAALRAAGRHDRGGRLPRRAGARQADGPARRACWSRCAPSRSTRTRCSRGCSTGCAAHRRGCTLHGAPAPAYADRAVLRRRAAPAGRCTSTWRGPGVNAPAEQLLRARGVALARARRRRCGAGRAGAVHQRRGRRPAARRGRGAVRGEPSRARTGASRGIGAPSRRGSPNAATGSPCTTAGRGTRPRSVVGCPATGT